MKNLLTFYTEDFTIFALIVPSLTIFIFLLTSVEHPAPLCLCIDIVSALYQQDTMGDTTVGGDANLPSRDSVAESVQQYANSREVSANMLFL